MNYKPYIRPPHLTMIDAVYYEIQRLKQQDHTTTRHQVAPTSKRIEALQTVLDLYKENTP